MKDSTKTIKKELSIVDSIMLGILAGVLLLLLVYINLISGLRVNKPLLAIILTSLHDLCYCFSILLYFRYPILTMLFTFVSQWFLIVEDCILGTGMLEALSNCGVVEVLVWCTIPMLVIYIVKQSDLSGLSIKGKFINVILSEEEPVKLKWWQEFIILCLSTTVILNVVNKYTLGFENNQTLAKVLSTIVMVLATLVTVLRFIRFSVFYKVIVLLQIAKITSLFTVVKTSEIQLENIQYIIIETLTIGYAVYLYYRYRDSSIKEEKGKANTKVKQVEK